MQRRRHVQILFVLSGDDYWIWGVVLISDIANDCGLVGGVHINGILRSHSHFLLKIYLGLVIALLSILDLLVPLVYQVIASCDVIMTVVFNAFLCVLSIEIVF